MKIVGKVFIPAVCILFVASIAMAGEMVREVTFQKSNLSFATLKDYDYVTLTGCQNLNRKGEPKLPVKYLSVLIPAGATVSKVEVISFDTEEIPGTYNIFPSQPPIPFIDTEPGPSTYSAAGPLSYKKPVEFVEPEPSIYTIKTLYPSDLLGENSTGNMGGFKIANIVLYPVRYIPADQKILFHSRIVIKIHYENAKTPPKGVTERELNLFKKRVSRIVENKQDVEIHKPPLRTSVRGSKSLPAGNYDYVVITAPDSNGIPMDTIFQRLADWKTKKGVPSKVVNVDWIYANYTGTDDQEKIRNFIKDANEIWGTMYFLLGGQCDWEFEYEIVPRRDVWYTLVYGGDADIIPCDHYLSDVCGDFYVYGTDWDHDDDGVYGELEDKVDLYSDVYIGRAPANSVDKAQTFVNKVLTYEKNPPPDYSQNMLLPAVELFADHNYWGDTVNNMIDDITPVGWYDNKLYESDGSLSKAAVIAALNAGVGFTHYAAHGNQWGIYYTGGAEVLDWFDVRDLVNGDRLGVQTGICCMTGAIDWCIPSPEAEGDCIAEKFVTNPNGGSVASIMNTRSGWGAIPGLGASENLDTTFYHAVFKDSIYHLGQALAAAKDPWVAQAIADGEYGYLFRWCIYELWLLGDPEMPLWTAIPGSLLVTHPDTLLMGSTEYFTVNVRDKGTGSAIQNALVCVMFDDMSLYQRGYTDAVGNITFTIYSPAINPLRITVTSMNYLPYEGDVTIDNERRCVYYYKHTIDDDNLGTSSGNGDGICNSGESIEMPLWVKNWGTQSGPGGTATDVVGTLRTSDAYATITDSVEVFGDIAKGDSALTPDDYDFTIASSCTNAHQIIFDLSCTGSNGSWISHPTVTIGTPVFAFVSDSVDDAGQLIPNGFLDPGETANMVVFVRNKGYGNATTVSAKLRSDDIYITITDSLADYGSIGTMTTGDNETNPFVIVASPVTPFEHKAIFELVVICSEGYTDTTQFHLMIGWKIGSTHPQGPDAYGYYAYDNTDSMYTECPVYSWIDISSIGTPLEKYDFGVNHVDLPFTFKYYGIDHNRLTISHNGWIAFGEEFEIAGDDCPPLYSIYPIPSVVGPSNMVALAWHWSTCSAGFWYYYDEPNHRFIVEYRIYPFDYWPEDTLEVILYDPAYYPTATGDGEIIVQYNDKPNATTHSMTVGIENPSQTDGFEYYYNAPNTPDLETYPPENAPLAPGRVIKWTTDPPLLEGYITPFVNHRSHSIDDAGQSRPNGLLDPGETVNIIVTLYNGGTEAANGTNATLSTDSPHITIMNGTAGFGDISVEGTGDNASNPFIVQADAGIDYEEVTFKLNITANSGNYKGESSFKEVVSKIRPDDPIGPDAYGYYAYDNTDTKFSESPIYDWFEINPDSGGPGNTTGCGGYAYCIKQLDIPFPFKFYGQSYDSVGMGSCGYISFTEGNNNDDYTHNYGLPTAQPPSAMIAGVWDKLDAWTGMSYYYDEANHRYILQYNVYHKHAWESRETFQIILYDTLGGTGNTGGPTLTGDGEIVIQYKIKPAELDFTTGIEDHTETDGIQYFYNADYDMAAAPIKAGRAIKFTTDPPVAMAKDVGISSLTLNPADVMDPGPDTVIAVIKNYGTETQSNFNVSCIVTDPDGITVLNDTVTIGALAYGADTTIHWVPILPAKHGDCVSAIKTLVAGDEKPDNNEKSASVHVMIPLSPPWSEGFEEEPFPSCACWDISGYWNVSTGHPAHSGSYYLGISEWFGNEGFLVTPKFDLGSSNALHYWWMVDGYLGPPSVEDSVYVEVSIDGGENWIDKRTLYPPGDTIVWYKDTVLFEGYRASDIRMRWHFKAGEITEQPYFGFMLDDLELVGGLAGSPYVTKGEKLGNNVKFTWQTLSGANHYVVYRNTDPSFVPGHSDSIGSTTDTFYTNVGVVNSSSSYYYLVKGVNAGGSKSAKSNMGYKLNKEVIENPSASDRNWMSLPWYSEYSTVSDLTSDLSQSGDPLTRVTNLRNDQMYEDWIWDPDFFEWGGANFAISPGRGYEVGAADSNTVILVGSNDPEGLVSLNENPSVSDRNWVSISYNAVYSTVSDITTEYAPSGDPLTRVTNLRNDQMYEDWIWDPDFFEWGGANFAISPGRGYEMVTIIDATWNPTEYTNESGMMLLAGRNSKKSDTKVYLGKSTEPDRSPVWSIKEEVDCKPAISETKSVSKKKTDYLDADIYEPIAEKSKLKSKKKIDYLNADIYKSIFNKCNCKDLGNRNDYRAVGISHIVRAYLRLKDFENLVFTVYRSDKPYDVLTENIVGSGIAKKDSRGAIWFNAGNFKRPWQHSEEVILIIEATKEGKGYFSVSNFKLDKGVDIQELGEVKLASIPDPVSKTKLSTVCWNEVKDVNIVGYSLYQDDKRINETVIKEKKYSVQGEINLKLVIQGGYETVYGSCQGSQSLPNDNIPISYAFNLYPNPFNKRTGINYALPQATKVEIKVYDVSGRQVKTLVSEKLEPGYYKTHWPGKDNIGRTVSAGIYFIRMNTKEFESQHKVIFVR